MVMMLLYVVPAIIISLALEDATDWVIGILDDFITTGTPGHPDDTPRHRRMWAYRLRRLEYRAHDPDDERLCSQTGLIDLPPGLDGYV